jgi:hypothetical protein
VSNAISKRIQGNLGSLEKAGYSVSKMDQEWSDRCEIHMTYCGVKVVWQVLFNLKDLSRPPDLICTNEWFSWETFPVDDALDVIAHWDAKDSYALWKLFKSIDGCLQARFDKDAKELRHERLLFEYDTTSQTKGIRYYVHPMEKLFCISHPLYAEEEEGFDQFLEECVPDDTSFLTVKYRLQDGVIQKVIPTLTYSSRYECLRKTVSPYPWDREMCLMNYIPMIVDAFRMELKRVIDDRKQRKEVFERCIVEFGNLIEMDSTEFQSGTFRLEDDRFVFIVTILLDEYPRPPILRFTSTMFLQKGLEEDGISQPIVMEKELVRYRAGDSASDVFRLVQSSIRDVTPLLKESCRRSRIDIGTPGSP